MTPHTSLGTSVYTCLQCVRPVPAVMRIALVFYSGSCNLVRVAGGNHTSVPLCAGRVCRQSCMCAERGTAARVIQRGHGGCKCRFHALSREGLVHAGQGVVAFARGVHNDLGYAFKFFVERGSFLAERDMYRTTTLGSLLQVCREPYISAICMHGTVARSCHLILTLRCYAPTHPTQDVAQELCQERSWHVNCDADCSWISCCV